MKNETSTTELLSSVLLNFNPPRRRLSIFRQLSVINKCDCRNAFLPSDRNCCGIHADTFTFRLVYIQGYNTSSPKSLRVVREFECLKTMRWVCRWSQVQSSHWGTGEWRYSCSATVAQRNTSGGKLHNIHFRGCFVFVSFSFFFFFQNKECRQWRKLKNYTTITQQVHQMLFAFH